MDITVEQYTNELVGFSKGGMPARNKRNYRPTKAGAGMTRAGVKAYRRMNPGSKLKTAVTKKTGLTKKEKARRKSFCARSRGWKSKRGKAARRRWRC